MVTARTEELLEITQRLIDGIPADVAEEVVVTGSVSRGIADEISDVEMLLVTPEPVDLDEAYALARTAGLESLGTWGVQSPHAQKVSGYFEDVPFELIWWPRDFAEERVDAMLVGESPSAGADALVHGLAIRSAGLLPKWQDKLRVVPDELAASRIEDAALPWGGFAAAGVLTLIRPHERLELTEWLVDCANRVLAIVYSLNRAWQPAPKRLAARLEPLPVKPDRTAERIESALEDLDHRTALLAMTELQLEAVELAPDGPNIVRARGWLAAAAELLRGAA